MVSSTQVQPPGTLFHPIFMTSLTLVLSENDSRMYFLIMLMTDYCWRYWTCRIAAPYKFYVDWLIDWLALLGLYVPKLVYMCHQNSPNFIHVFNCPKQKHKVVLLNLAHPVYCEYFWSWCNVVRSLTCMRQLFNKTRCWLQAPETTMHSVNGTAVYIINESPNNILWQILMVYVSMSVLH